VPAGIQCGGKSGVGPSGLDRPFVSERRQGNEPDSGECVNNHWASKSAAEIGLVAILAACTECVWDAVDILHFPFYDLHAEKQFDPGDDLRLVELFRLQRYTSCLSA